MKYLVRSVCAVALLLCIPAQAQPITDVVPRDLYTDTLRQNGNSITFCFNPDGMMAGFEQELADTIGSVLLTEVDVKPLKPNGVPTNPLDFRLPYLPQQLFVVLVEDCDAIMGFVLSRSIPNWASVTRPYLSTGSNLITRDAALTALDDLPLDQRIATRSLSLSDNRLASFLRTRPEGQRWVRTPLYSNQRVLERLDAGEVGAAIVWEPALYFATDGEPEAAGYHILPLPFVDRRTEIGIATRSNNTYLNSILGDAIGELISDGTLDEMVQRFHLGPTSTPQ